MADEKIRFKSNKKPMELFCAKLRWQMGSFEVQQQQQQQFTLWAIWNGAESKNVPTHTLHLSIWAGIDRQRRARVSLSRRAAVLQFEMCDLKMTGAEKRNGNRGANEAEPIKCGMPFISSRRPANVNKYEKNNTKTQCKQKAYVNKMAITCEPVHRIKALTHGH